MYYLKNIISNCWTQQAKECSITQPFYDCYCEECGFRSPSKTEVINQIILDNNINEQVSKYNKYFSFDSYGYPYIQICGSRFEQVTKTKKENTMKPSDSETAKYYVMDCQSGTCSGHATEEAAKSAAEATMKNRLAGGYGYAVVKVLKVVGAFETTKNYQWVEK